MARIKYYDGINMLSTELIFIACLIVEVRDHRPRGQQANTASRGGPFITPSPNASIGPARLPTSAPTKELPRVYRTLLRPTEQSLWQDFGQLADTSGG